MFKKIVFGIFILLVSQFALAKNVPVDIKACFTPSENCTSEIVSEIDKAKKSLYMQAYSFTSDPISKALVEAKKRGVDVKVLLDKSQVKAKYSSASYLDSQGIWTRIDYLPAIAHNKVIVIDGKTVITGSFNFTKAAQFKNAENLLVIQDAELAEQYTRNWFKRAGVSVAKDTYLAMRNVKNM